MPPRSRIGPDGSIIRDGDESSADGSGGGGGERRRLFRLPHHVDTFGFNLELKHFALVLLFVSMTMGTFAFGLFVIALSIYNYRQSSSSGGGGGSRWNGGKVSGGANIKGVGDLPKAPKGG